MTTSFKLNGKSVSVDAPEDASLMWVLRERQGLTGTKYCCGLGVCGACTVHLDGAAVRSCNVALSKVAGKEVTTIEGLSATGDHPLQRAWIAEQAPQCGYCHSGQIMQAAALLAKNSSPSRDEIIDHINTVLCRCGAYGPILRAIERAAKESR